MSKTVLLIFTTGLFFSHSTYSDSMSSKDPTNRFSQIHYQIEQDRLFYSAGLSERDLIRSVQFAINGANPDHVGLSIPELNKLSRAIVAKALCYKIDPLVFASLIWRESHFIPEARSYRGAVGLTQMTRIGIQEILERVSAASPRKLAHLRALVSSCDPEIFHHLSNVPTQTDVSIWKRKAAVLGSYAALTFGAVLLKLNLALAPTQKIESLYRVALEHYNGDPDVKEGFAVQILKHAKAMVKAPDTIAGGSKSIAASPAI